MAESIQDCPANNQEGVAQTAVSLRNPGGNSSNPLDDPLDGTTPYYDLKSKHNADDWYQRFRIFRRPIEGHTGRGSGQIRIAVLDTGIDKSMLTAEFCENIKGDKNFLPGEDAGASDDLDGNHHGTHVVSILLNLAPWVHVYVARIAKDGHAPMDPSCIAKAIRYAVEDWNVHIISMSWGFKEEHECISEAIRLGYSKDKIMFAAASNEGANLPVGLGVTFPASMPEVICVNSGDGFGNRSDFNPPPRKGIFNFLTLGEAISASNSALRPKRQTGTSFATPTAAAIAASLLEFVMQKQILKGHDALKQLAATRDGMIKLLVAMSEPVFEFMYLRPWDLIECKGSTDTCSCKSCRKMAEAKLRQVLEGPFPVVQINAPFLDLPDKLPSAAFDAMSRQNTSSCLPRTRVDLLAEIRQWADGGDIRRVYWLMGMAGTGKSTIALTVAREYHKKGRLGGSFFFSRGHADLALSPKFVVTIASQLAQYSEELRMRIQEAVTAHPDISSKGLYYQWEQLVLRPLSSARSQGPYPSLLIVVDALDECEGGDDVRLLIRCLASTVPPGGYQLRILITSRPEQQINIGFAGIPAQEHQRFVLHDMETSIVDQDLAEFYKHQLEETNRDFGLQDLLCDATIDNLVRRSCGLFIYAATVCRFVHKGGLRGARRLSDLINAQGLCQKPMEELDKLYITILQSSTIGNLDPEEAVGSHESVKSFEWFRRIVGTIIVLFDTLSSANLCTLLGESNLRPALDYFHSVLNVPEQHVKPIGIVHPSFRDFLLDPSRCLDSRFFIPEEDTHRNLLGCCLRVMESGLHFNMCSFEKPGTRVHEVSKALLNELIPIPVQYACRYWVDHLQRSNLSPAQHGGITALFRHRFLFWVETLSWTGQLVYAIAAVQSLQRMLDENMTENTIDAKISPVNLYRSFLSALGAPLGKSKPNPMPSDNLTSMVYDAARFLSSHGAIIKQAPLQIYSSALLFSPTESVTRKHYAGYIPEWVPQAPCVTENWSSHLQTIKHSTSVSSIMFSPNGTMHATEVDKVVRVWDTASGTENWLPKHHSRRVKGLYFSPDGEQLATVSAGGDDKDEIRLWNTRMGADYLSLGQVLRWVDSLMFSPNGKHLTAVSHERENLRCKVETWDTTSGSTLQDFDLEGFLNATAYSSDGKIIAIAIGQTNPYISLLNLEDGITQRVPTPPATGNIAVIAISPDKKFVALRTFLIKPISDRSTSIWLVNTTTKSHRLVNSYDCGSARMNRSLVFSPDGQVLAACGNPTHGYLFDVVTGKKKWTSDQLSYTMEAMSFSPDGRFLAVACRDWTTRLLDTSNGNQKQIFKGHSGSVFAISFSPDGNVIATASDDRTVRRWEIAPSTSQEALVPNQTRTSAITFSPDWKLMVTESNSDADTGVQLRDARTGACIYEWDQEIQTSVFSPDVTLLAMLHQDNNIFIWDISRGSERWLGNIPPHLRFRYRYHDFSIPMCFSADGKSLATPWQVDHEHPLGVVIWDVETGTRLKFLTNSNYHCITAFSFTLDGEVIIAAHRGGFGVWHLQSGANLWNVEASREGLGAGPIASSPNSRFFATCSLEADTIHLWDMESRTTVQSISSQSKFLCFSPDGAKLASLSMDYSVTIWDINTGVVLQKHIFNTSLRELTFSSCGNYLKTNMGSFPASGHVVDRLPNLFSGDWVKAGGDEVLFIHPDFQNQIGYVDGYSIVFLHAKGVESQLVLNSLGRFIY